MFSSTSIEDTDGKKGDFCPTCRELLRWQLQSEVQANSRRLTPSQGDGRTGRHGDAATRQRHGEAESRGRGDMTGNTSGSAYRRKTRHTV
jgi:hypothetical protein